MAGQPEVFDFGRVIATETPGGGVMQPPMFIVQAPNTLKLRTYFHCGGSAFERAGVDASLTAVGAQVVYFFDDLEAGGTPVKVAGGAISVRLQPADKDFAFGTSLIAGPTPGVVGKDLEGSGLNPADDYWLSIDTAPISTGTAATLDIPIGRTSGSWRVLTHITGAGAFQVSAFDDNLLVHVRS